jgi:hypothetical protein
MINSGTRCLHRRRTSELAHAVGEDLTHPLGVETVDVAPADTTGTN